MVKAFATFKLSLDLMCLKIVIETQGEAFIKSAGWLIVG